MIRLKQKKVLQLHQLLTDATGGDPGIRDSALLDSALESVFQTFGGKELYPSLEEKAARLGFSLISNHAFVDGNKRIGMFAMLIFLEVNGIRLNCRWQEVSQTGLSAAAGKIGYEELLFWILEHKE